MDHTNTPGLSQQCCVFDLPAASSIGTNTRKRSVDALSHNVATEAPLLKRRSSAVAARKLFSPVSHPA